MVRAILYKQKIRLFIISKSRSLLIRYPYELTVRGVLKYQILPYLPTLTQLHSVRVCKMSRIDPATGKISDSVSLPEKSICDDPSPVEGSTFKL
jgi:hypothetical protein